MSKQEINLLHDYLFVLLQAASHKEDCNKTPLQQDLRSLFNQIIAEVELQVATEEAKYAEELETFYHNAQQILNQKLKELDNEDKYTPTQSLILRTSMENELMLSLQVQDTEHRRIIVDLRERLSKEALNSMHKVALSLGIAVPPDIWQNVLLSTEMPGMKGKKKGKAKKKTEESKGTQLKSAMKKSEELPISLKDQWRMLQKTKRSQRKKRHSAKPSSAQDKSKKRGSIFRTESRTERSSSNGFRRDRTVSSDRGKKVHFSDVVGVMKERQSSQRTSITKDLWGKSKQVSSSSLWQQRRQAGASKQPKIEFFFPKK